VHAASVVLMRMHVMTAKRKERMEKVLHIVLLAEADAECRGQLENLGGAL
jgi:hypothetical protein